MHGCVGPGALPVLLLDWNCRVVVAGHRRPRSTGWVYVRIQGPRCPPAGPVRYLVSIRVGRARRAARKSRRSKAPDRDGGR